eukprot:scaffold2708_cov158-Ochromonas_danica.AAC.20
MSTKSRPSSEVIQLESPNVASSAAHLSLTAQLNQLGQTSGSQLPITTPDEARELIEKTKVLAGEIRLLGQENKKIEKIKGNEELMLRIDEVLVEIEEQSDKLLSVSASPAVQRDLLALQKSLEEVKDFFSVVSRASMFASRQKLKLRMQNVYQSLRARCTQLMTAVSLELLTKKPQEEVIVLQASHEAYQRGLAFAFALHGKPQSLSLAFENFVQAAEGDHAEAMVMVAKCYREGQGVEKSLNMALHWLNKAIQSEGLAHAKTLLAQIHLDELRRKRADIVTRYFRAGREGPREGKERRNKLSSSLSSLRDDEDDLVEEEEQLEDHEDFPSSHQPVAEENDLDEQCEEMQRVVQLLLEAAQEGHAEARDLLGQLYEEAGARSQAARWYSLASSAGSSQASCHLADLLLYAPTSSGTLSSVRNKAFSLYTIALRNGARQAHAGLGLCYELGLGVEVSLSNALFHYEAAARAGEHQAMYSLGYLLLQQGLSMPAADQRQKVDEGVRWLRAAEEHGVADASFQLARLYEQGLGLPEDAHAALEHYLLAAKRDHAKAAYFAANLLYDRRDFSRAADFYQLAAQIVHSSNQSDKEVGAQAANNFALLLEEGKVSAGGGGYGSQGGEERSGPAALLTACAYYFEAVQAHYRPAYFNLLLLLYNYNVQTFLSLKEEVIQVAQLLPRLRDALEEDLKHDGFESEQQEEEVEEKVKKAHVLLDAVEHNLQGIGGGSGGGGQQPVDVSAVFNQLAEEKSTVRADGKAPLYHFQLPASHLLKATRRPPSTSRRSAATMSRESKQAEEEEEEEDLEAFDLVLRRQTISSSPKTNKAMPRTHSSPSPWSSPARRVGDSRRQLLSSSADGVDWTRETAGQGRGAGRRSSSLRRSGKQQQLVPSPCNRLLLTSSSPCLLITITGEVYVTSGPIAPPHYVPKATLQNIPLTAADRKPSSKSANMRRGVSRLADQKADEEDEREESLEQRHRERPLPPLPTTTSSSFSSSLLVARRDERPEVHVDEPSVRSSFAGSMEPSPLVSRPRTAEGKKSPERSKRPSSIDFGAVQRSSQASGQTAAPVDEKKRYSVQ